MASINKNLMSRKRRNKRSDENSDSDSDGGAAEEGAAPPKKPKLVMPLKRPGPKADECESACSSPSASGFIIAPSQKPQPAATTTKKGSASKVFSEDNVILLLKRLAVFWANGKNNKWAEFHLFVNDDLGNQFTKIQVSEKIRSLKKKFDAYWERAKANGGRLDLSDPHESAVFELSKALWGEEKGQMVENGVRTEKEQVVEKDEESKKRKQVTEKGDDKKKSKKAEQGVEELREEGIGVDNNKKCIGKEKEEMEIGVEEFESAYPLLYASFNSSDYPKVGMMDTCVGIGRENAEELEQKLREIHIEMHRLELKRLHLITRQCQPK